MFGFGKQALDDETIALIAMRAGVLDRAEERDRGRVDSNAIHKWVEFAIKEKSVKPDERSMTLIQYSSIAIATDVTGFTDGLLNKLLKGHLVLTQNDVQRAIVLTSKAVKDFAKGMK